MIKSMKMWLCMWSNRHLHSLPPRPLLPLPPSPPHLLPRIMFLSASPSQAAPNCGGSAPPGSGAPASAWSPMAATSWWAYVRLGSGWPPPKSSWEEEEEEEEEEGRRVNHVGSQANDVIPFPTPITSSPPIHPSCATPCEPSAQRHCTLGSQLSRADASSPSSLTNSFSAYAPATP